MKNLIKIRLFLITVLFILGSLVSAYSHNNTDKDKELVYKSIKTQLDENKISLKTAQEMWFAYVRCCKDQPSQETQSAILDPKSPLITESVLK
jgi:hypothetical protein